MSKVLILLSTYNGELYIREQIESLLNQKGVDITILVRDDQSNDRTVEILQEFEKKTGKIILIKGTNCGACNSFLKLMEEASKSINSYNYFAFCDQDDVWLEDKLMAAIEILENSKNKNIPSLYMSAYQMVDVDLKEIKTPVRTPLLSVPTALASNCATGCTMVFNSVLLADVIGYRGEDILMHDYWTYLVCLVKGGCVYYDPIPHILYRQHGNNVIGGRGDSFFKRWYLRFKKIFRQGDNFKSKLANILISQYGNQMSLNDYRFLENLRTSKKLSSKFYILMCNEFWSVGFDCKIKNLGLLLTGKI